MSSDPDEISIHNKQCSNRISLPSSLEKRLEELLFADRSILVLIHSSELLLKFGFIKFLIRFHSVEHLNAELANLRLLKLLILVGIDLSEKFLRGLTQLFLRYLRHLNSFYYINYKINC